MIRLVNKTRHSLMIDYATILDPMGSVEIEDWRLTDHIRQMERNGFIRIEHINENPVAPVVIEIPKVIVEDEIKAEVSQKTSKNRKTTKKNKSQEEK